MQNATSEDRCMCEGPLIMMTGSLKKKKKKKVKKKKGGCSVIRACSPIRSNTVYVLFSYKIGCVLLHLVAVDVIHDSQVGLLMLYQSCIPLWIHPLRMSHK